jgi:flavodoxin
MMNYVIVYWSRYGNGKKIVDYLANKLKQKNADTKIFNTDEVDPSSMPEADFYIFSAPTEAFNLQGNMRSFMKRLDGMDGKKYGIINTHGMKRNLLGKMEKLLAKKNMEMVASVDFKVDKEVNTGNGLMDGWETQVDTFIEQLSKQ